MARISRQRRWVLIAGAVVVLFTLLGFFAAPPILKAQLVQRLSAELGREVSVDKIRLNPYTLSITLEGFAIKDRDGGPFVGWRRVYVNFDSTSLFVREWRFQEISAAGPALRVIVNKDGSFNFSDLLAKFAAAPTKPAERKPSWPLRISHLVVSEAALDFFDHSRSAEFVTHAGPVSFELKNFHTSPGNGAPYEFSAATEAGENLTWRGTLSAAPLGSQGEFTLAGIKLPKYAPYYRDLVRFDLTGGSLDVAGRYEADLGGPAPRASLAGGTVHLRGLKLAPRDEKTAVVELDDLSIAGIDANVEKLSVAIREVALTGGRVSAQRAQDGTIDLLSLLAPAAATAPPTVSPASASATPSSPAKKPDLKIAEVAVRKFAMTFTDHATPRMARNTIENLEADFKNVTLADGAAIPLRVAMTFPDQGVVQIAGDVTLSPLKAEVDVTVDKVGFSGVSPYVEPMLNLRIAQGTFSAKGHAGFSAPAGAPPKFSFKGDTSVDRFLAVAGEANDEFSSWSALTIQGIGFVSAPLALAVNEIVWSDLAAHLIVNGDGSNNLAMILRKSAPVPPAANPAATSGAPDLAPSVSPVVPTAGAASVPLPKVSVGKITFANAAFTFADRSVSPAVGTAINQFGGTIAGLSSTNLAKADVDLKAMVDGIGPIAIIGKLDPLSVDLTPFSPYAAKFAGYELARGKLFLDVAAKLNGDKIAVANVVTLTQFTFGAASNSPDATKLPVRLGVALLKDTDGKMIIDIPVAGSLGDPEFRIGRVVWRVIGNLLTKAATSPFSLLGSMFGGGGDELAFQEFAAGSSELAPENLAKLSTLTKALEARPGLNLGITGSFDSAADGAALKQELLAKQIRAKVWEMRRTVDPSVAPPDQLLITPEEEAEKVRQLFAEKFPAGVEVAALPPVVPARSPAPIPKKRNVLVRVVDAVTFKSRRAEKPVGATSAVSPTAPAQISVAGPEVPLEEMKRRLVESVSISADDLRRLATARGQKVRDHFVQAQIAPERLFLINEPATKGAQVLLELQ